MRLQGHALLLLVSVISLVCCGAEGPRETPPPPEGVEERPVEERSAPVDDPETVADIDDPWLRLGEVVEWRGDLDDMRRRGFVRLLTPADRTHYFVGGARERGIAVRTAEALEALLNEGAARGEAVHVIVIPVRRDQLLPLLERGRGDVAIGNLTVTPERQEIVDFTAPFVSDVDELVVTAPGQPPVATLQDLACREIWVRRSSSYHASLLRVSEQLVAEGLRPIDVRRADENLEDEGLLEMVNAGLYPATVVDSHKLAWLWAKVFDKLTVSDVAVREKGDVAAAVRKDAPEFRAALADFYRTRRVGTTFGNILVRRYLASTTWVKGATSTAERRKFDAVVDLFRKYSAQYDFDYLMMIAQGYQESRLDPNARSHVGAIGLMQSMPATAAGAPLSMPDVDAPEPNIHAGIKYMRYLVDQHFQDPAIDDVNRLLLAFAGYNAGPNRIARLRRLAPEYGADPNVWFGNVERIVASRVSREPVVYVRNIYKYYLAYRRLRDIERERDNR